MSQHDEGMHKSVHMHVCVCRCECDGACVLSRTTAACKISRAYYIGVVKGSRVHCVHSEATCHPNTRIFTSAQSGAPACWVVMSDSISPTGHLSQQTHALTSGSWSLGVSAGSLSRSFFSFGKKHRVWSRSLGSRSRVRCCCSRWPRTAAAPGGKRCGCSLHNDAFSVRRINNTSFWKTSVYLKYQTCYVVRLSDKLPENYI